MTKNRNLLILLFLSASMILLSCEEYEDDLYEDEFDEDEDLYARATGTVTYQAENHSFQRGCNPSSKHNGYTGTGFMDYGGNGSLVEWNNINAPSAGQYKLTFRYANGSGGPRQCVVTVNDTTGAGNVSFAPTGAWTTWSSVSIAVNLKAGNNKIRVTANTSSGGPNLDKIDVSSAGGGGGDSGGGDGECAEVVENQSAKLSCPSGQVITAIGFASYGVPTGSCAAGFSIGKCHSSTSKSKVQSLCLNKQSCAVGANNGTFGDPCVGTFKKLAVTYSCKNGDGGDDGGGDNGGNEKLKVFILAGQSNMVGQGTVNPTQAHLDKNGGKGTLKYLTTNANTRTTYAHLVKSNGGWMSRSDVWLVDLDKSGPLTINKETFGPELQFGHVVGDYYSNPVLIIKTSWGGKSLKVDFRPPSSGGTVGPYYTAMVQRVRQVLNNLREFYPSYNGKGYEIAGFGWHQGWNDRIDTEAVNTYQTNCVNLINDLRRELNSPNMPFVLATTGIGGWNETHPRGVGLMNAQLAVPKDSRLKSGYVFAVETRDYWRDQSVSPADQGYHWNRNAETYFLIGNGLGKAMINLIKTP